MPRANGHGCEPLAPPPDACGPGTMPALGSAQCRPVGWTTCPQGFEADPSGWGCVDVVPEGDCPPGTFATLGSRACQPVGWTSCDGGFTPDPSGWGCDAVLPSSCSGATVERLGSSACVSVGDCGAPFPPAEATLFVDQALSTEDATHFRSLSAAVAAAPPGATVAVESGRYVEALAFAKPLRVVGRCPERVVLQSDGGAAPGLAVMSTDAVEVRGLSVIGHRGGAVVEAGGALTLEGVLLDDNREKGLYASGAGSRITASRSAIRRTRATTSGAQGEGAGAFLGAQVALTDCALVENRAMAVFASSQGSRLTLSRGIVRGTFAASDGQGYGAFVSDGASAELSFAAVVETQGVGMLATGAGTKLTLRDGVVRDTRSNLAGTSGLGVYVDFGARLELERVAVVKNRILGVNVVQGGTASIVVSVVRATAPLPDGTLGHGVNVQAQGASATLTSCALVDNREIGLAVLDAPATATVVRSLIRDTQRSPNGLAGLGVGALVGNGASLAFSGTALVMNHQAALVAGRGGVAVGDGSLLAFTQRNAADPDAPLVQGAVAESAGRLELSRSSVFENEGVGVYAWGAGDDGGVPSQATLTQCLVRDNRPPMPRPGETGNGAGLMVDEGASATVIGGGLVRNLTAGILADTRASVAVEDALVRGNLVNGQGQTGRAVNVQGGASATVTRSALVENHEMSVFVGDADSSLRLTSCLLAHTQPDAYGYFGRAAEVVSGTLSIEDSALLDSHDVGVHALGPTARAVVKGSLLDGVVPIPDGRFGYGAMAREGGQLELDGTWVRRASAVGVVFAQGAAGALRRSFISDHPVALHVQDLVLVEVDGAPALPDAGVVAVSRDTEFVDDLVRLGAGTVPLPPITTGIREDQQR